MAVLSFATHGLLVMASWVFLSAITGPDGNAIGIGPLLALVPLVMLMTVLPVSLGGWGVREVAMVTVLTPLGVPAAAAVTMSVCLGLGQFLIGLPGGLLWLRGR